MSTIYSWPTGRIWLLERFQMAPIFNHRAHSSPFGGSEQVVDLLNERWSVTASLSPCSNDDAAAREAFFNKLRGMDNRVYLWHMRRPVPRGTMRGSPVVAAGGVAQGAQTINITTSAGATVLAGDVIGLAGQLLMAAQDCTADGAGAMAFVAANKVRAAASAGAAITWDAPTAPFRCMVQPGISYVPGYSEGVQLEFIEAWVS